MIDLTGVKHHPAIEEVVEVLCNKTGNTDRSFFRSVMAYFLGKMASNMRATIKTKDRGEIPVNIYALALATSGFGKGHSVNIIEEQFMAPFRKRFMNDTFQTIAEQHLYKIADDRAVRNGTDQQEEMEKIEKEFRSAGAFPFTFDSGTVPAVKQMRSKLLLSGIGSINMQIDEIGSNLIGSIDILTLFLELYDQGMVKQKLTKNTAENQRAEEMDGKTPTNMLLFGTPSKLLDGGITEDQFYSFLDTGYARRCIFGMGLQHHNAYELMTPTEIYNNLVQPTNGASVNKWAMQFHKLADPAMFGWKMTVDDPVGIQLLTYKIDCEKRAAMLPDHAEIKKAELSHRYFKALKLAGAYAFVDQSSEVELDHLMSAILLVEESGAAFQQILNREPAYAKLARYVADIENEVTHADLMEALPFYKSGAAARNEMISLATAWGHKRHIIIKKTFVDGIEFFKGEKLKETDLNEMIVSYSDHWAYNYLNEAVPFDKLHVLTQAPGMNWANHQFKNGHRADENVFPGFNMIVIDVDEGISLETCHELMKDYRFMTYTTKRHQEFERMNERGEEEYGPDRFRLVLPINYHLTLDADEYKEFINSFMGWLPFKSDEAANQRSKKWSSFEGGEFHYNMEGEILDALPFIPKTAKNEAYKKDFQSLGSLDNLERWFAQRIAMGNRNNQMIKYALALVDGGMSLMEVSKQVHTFNAKLSNALTEDEIDKTILTTVAKRFERR